MKQNRYGFAMNEDDSDDEDIKEDSNHSPNNSDAPDYAFEGYDVEINAKVALLPKTTNKV